LPPNWKKMIDYKGGDQMTEETKATIPEIQALYGEHAAGILNRLRDQYEEIATAKPETQGSFFDRLDDAQKKAAIREYRLKLANEARNEAKAKYTEAVREYRDRVEQRKAQADAELFGHGDAIAADVIASAALLPRKISFDWPASHQRLAMPA
jgi:hypothetical protein